MGKDQLQPRFTKPLLTHAIKCHLGSNSSQTQVTKCIWIHSHLDPKQAKPN
ncbi:uncharacterized protein DS421_17g585080 [Arachis hypogaea]|nr:uncharacterized protein DS421_17g585080 [Arachis hypogaea]